MSVLDVINKTPAAGNSNTGADTVASKKEDPQDRFLKLLVTQMKNQDPLNPLDNAQVTSQIAQISTVSGIERLNTSLQGMGDSMLAAQSMQASAMIGHGVLAEGDRMELISGGAVAGIELAGPAEKVVVSIYAASGERVEALDLGRQDAGLGSFAWDGRPDGAAQLPDGTYKFKVEAFRADGTKVDVTTLAYGRVQSVSLDGGLTLNTATLGAIPVANVRQII